MARILALSLALCAVCAPLAAGQPLSGLGAEDGVLLLRNGQVLRGKIAHAGDLYYVFLDGGEIRVPLVEVEFCCRDLEEGYALKRDKIEPRKVEDHLRLAQWCLRHNLTGYAATQLATAKDADARDPRIPLLERRLKLALAEPAPEKLALAAANPIAELHDLDRLIHTLPVGTVETFTGSIQPLLLNHCSVANCHGVSSTNKLRLLRGPSGRPASRRLTQRNLHTVLTLVDRAQPAESLLISTPIRPHGPLDKPVFTNQQLAKFKQLVAWVHEVSKSSAPAPPSTVAEPSPLLQTLSSHAAGKRDRYVGAATGGELPTSTAVDSAQLAESSVSASGEEPPASVPDSLPKAAFVPVDEFDPRIFNRRFFGEDDAAEDDADEDDDTNEDIDAPVGP
jgi:hypothetical protein